MMGLALGSYIAKPLLAFSRKPLLLLAGLELGIAAYGVFSLSLLDGAGVIYGNWVGGQLVTEASRRIVLRAAVCAGGLIVPTTLMGLTFPVLLQAVRPGQDNAGAMSAVLYAANTAGAALGALITGFFLIALCGLTGSVWVAGGLNCAAAALIFIHSRTQGSSASPEEAGSSHVESNARVATMRSTPSVAYWERWSPDSSCCRCVVCVEESLSWGRLTCLPVC